VKASDLERAILQALAAHGDNYAIGLGSLLHTDRLLYATLRDLERQGLLGSYDGDPGMPERGGRPRRYYALTDKGRERLRREAMT